MSQPSCAFRDWPLGNLHFGFPQLCCLPNGRLLASTWSGHCLEIDPDWGGVKIQPQIGGGPGAGALSCPAATGAKSPLCTAATGVIWAELWRLGNAHTTRIDAEDAVNAVAFSGDGDILALGLGAYPLKPTHHPRAEVVLHSTDDLSEPLGRTVLPGVAVDRIVFHPRRDALIAVTGARSQDRGYVAVLDPHTLSCVDMAETGFVFGYFLEVDAGADRLMLAHQDGIEVRELDRLQQVKHEWRGDELYGAAYNPDRRLIFLSSGEVLDHGCQRIGNLPVLEKCTGLALLDDGRLAGISETGILRVWETGPEWEIA